MRALLLLALLPVAARAQTPLRPGACAAAGTPAPGWTEFSHSGLRIAFKLPPELHAFEYKALAKVSDAARRKEIPTVAAESVELVLAWELPKKVSGPVQRLLLYRAKGAAAPEGRPCALTVAGSPALLFRSAQTSANHASDEYWIEAYWPGFVLAAVGTTSGVYEAALAILRSVTVTP